MATTFDVGEYVFFMDDKEKWLPGKVKKAFKPGEAGEVELLDGEERRLTAKATKDCCVVEEAALAPVENLVKMNNLNEPLILHCLRQRFLADKIYTNIGNILIAVNPFRLLPIYTPDVLEKYKDGGGRSQPPHIFAIADYAYSNMQANNASQSVVISGESGAGKTETMKLVLQFIAEVSGRAQKQGQAGEKQESLEQQILKSNPVMEAFGNAKTTRNNNSSRFGKWTEILFNTQGAIVGGSIINYLLEKSRIPFQAKDERNYHIFYQLLAGAELDPDLKRRLHIQDADDYHYMNQSGVTTVDTINDEKEWEELNGAMDVLNWTEAEKAGVFKTTAAILQLGNAEFQGEGGDDEISQVKSTDVVARAAELFEVDAAALAKCLTKKRITGNTFKNYTVAGANDARDALAKQVYSKMFDWLIVKINYVLGGAQMKEEAKTTGLKLTHIGVLDIFGFEFFETNSFEQLCINFCNEKLQFHFNEHIFKLEQAEYQEEGIDVSAIEFADNQPTLDLLEKKSVGVFAMIDEEISVPKGSDQGLLNKVIKKHAKHGSFAKPKPKDKDSDKVFVIKHYAAAVHYNTTGFLEKNKDSLAADITEVMAASSSSFVSSLMTSEASASGGSGKKKKSKKAATLGAKFKKSLNDLMSKLNATEPHFVRCMKPNHEKKGGIFTSEIMLDQLRNAGLLEVCRIRQIGYPVRKAFADFVFRYRCLDLIAATGGHEALLEAFTARGIATRGEWQIGRNKVFMRNQQEADLEGARESSLRGVVTTITKLVRKFIARCRFRHFMGILSRIDGALEARTEKALDTCLSECAELPWGGEHVPKVRAARALKERLEEERRVTGLVADAIAARDLADLKAAIGACEAMEPAFEPDNKAEAAALVQTIETEKACVARVQAAIDARVKADLEAALAEARTLGEFVTGSEAFKQGEILKKRMDEEDAARSAIRAAIDAKDYDALCTCIEQMVELGLEEALLEEGRALKTTMEEQEKAKKRLKAALPDRKLDELQAALAQGEKAGLEAAQEDMAAAKAVEQRVLEERATVQQLADATKANEQAALEAAIQRAETMAPPLTDTVGESEELSQAQRALQRLKDIAECKEQLQSATSAAKFGPLTAALRRAADLGIETGPEVEAAKALQEELGEQFKSLMDLEKAIDAVDLAAIDAALAKCQEMGLSDEETVTKGRQERERIVKQNELATSLRGAVEARDMEALKTQLKQADALNLAVRKDVGGVVEEARAVLADLRDLQDLLQSIESANKAGDQGQLEALLARAQEKGSEEAIKNAEEGLRKLEESRALTASIREALAAKDKPRLKELLAEADEKGVAGDAVEEARQLVSRAGREESAKAELLAAVEAHDGEALAAAMEKAMQMGLAGDEMDKAKEAQKKLDGDKELAGTLRAAMRTLENKADSKAGVKQEDISPLEAAIAEAIEAGLAEGSKYVTDARALQERAESMLVVEEELRGALDEDKLRALKRALDKAEDLEMKCSLVKAARKRVRELERERFEVEDEDEEPLSLEDPEVKKAREEKFKKASQARFHFSKFARIRSPDDFAKGVFWNKTKVKAAQLRFQNTTITTSLLDFADRDMVKTATRIHKALLGYCGDRAMAFPAMLAQDILEKGLQRHELADEIYVQICKHLTHNPRTESEIRAWQVLCMCVGTFPPSRDFENYLLNFILAYKDGTAAQGNYARYALRRLEGIINSGPSGFVPSVDEIMAYTERPPILATIELVDGTPLTEDLPITPDLNVGKVLDICNHFMELQDERMRYMGIFVEDIDDEDEDAKVVNPLADGDEQQRLPKTPRPLQNDGFMGDVVTVKVRQNQPFKFVYKRKIFLKNADDPSEDDTWEKLMYMQCVDEVIRGNIPLDHENEVARFIARALYADIEELPDDVDELLDAGVGEYVPYVWREEFEDEEWAERILEVCKGAGKGPPEPKEGEPPAEEGEYDPDFEDPREADPFDAQAALVDTFKTHPLYGTCFFHVRKNNFPEELEDYPEQLLVALNSEGLHFLDENRDTLCSYGYADIFRWGGSSTQFSIIIWNAATQDTDELSMFTSQAADMAALILDYINSIMAQES